jgi:elongation factor 1-alpha
MNDETIRIAVAGNVDSGKSTLAGVLLNNCLDDGRGYCRSLILRNKHEQDTGRTSCISFNNFYKENEGSRKIISLIDLAGHEKYLKTTMSGITGLFVDYGLVLVAANMGITKMTKEHIGLLLFLKVPIIILVTKIDMVPEQLKHATIRKLKKIANLPVFNKKAYTFPEDDDKCKNEMIDFSMLNDPLDTFIPIINVSNKTGQNIDNLKNLLFSLDSREHWSEKIDGSIVYVDSKYTVKGIGLVLSGTVRGKPIKTNQKLFIGPINEKFIPFKVRSLHNNMRENIEEAKNNEICCIAVRFTGKDTLIKKQVPRGVIIVDSEKLQKNICRRFKAEVTVLSHSTTISNNYQPVIHCGLVRQTARIKILENLLKEENKSDKNLKLRTGNKAIVEFEFSFKSEYIEEGVTFFFRDGNTKGYGKILEVYSIN